MSSNSGQTGGAYHPDSFVFHDSGVVGLLGGVWGLPCGQVFAGGVKRGNVAGLGQGLIRTGKSKGCLAGVKWL